jgi:hypothetical protein
VTSTAVPTVTRKFAGAAGHLGRPYEARELTMTAEIDHVYKIGPNEAKAARCKGAQGRLCRGQQTAFRLLNRPGSKAWLESKQMSLPNTFGVVPWFVP